MMVKKNTMVKGFISLKLTKSWKTMVRRVLSFAACVSLLARPSLLPDLALV